MNEAGELLFISVTEYGVILRQKIRKKFGTTFFHLRLGLCERFSCLFSSPSKIVFKNIIYCVVKAVQSVPTDN